MNGMCVYCGGVSEVLCPECRREIEQERRQEIMDEVRHEEAKLREEMNEEGYA